MFRTISFTYGYYKVDLEVVWKTLQRDLPILYTQIAALIASLSS
nr:hypothetical protein [Herbaspirillum sp. ASV7]